MFLLFFLLISCNMPRTVLLAPYTFARAGPEKAVWPYYKSVLCPQIGHTIRYLLTKLGRTEWENIWLEVMAHGPRACRTDLATP